MPNKSLAIQLEPAEQTQLEKWESSYGTPQQVALRCRIILGALAGQDNVAIAEQLGVSRTSLQLWRQRVSDQGIGQVWEIAPGRGRKPQYDQATRDKIIQATLRSKPKGMTHWSCRLMAEEQEVSKNTVNRLWQLHNLKPHLSRTFKLSRDAKFLEKLTDVVGLYLNPPDKTLVLCLDEKSQIQALDRTQPGLPLKQGRCGTMTHDYKRPWHDDPLCGPGSLTGPGHRPVLRAASASGVFEIPASIGPGVSGGHAVTLGHGQL